MSTTITLPASWTTAKIEDKLQLASGVLAAFVLFLSAQYPDVNAIIPGLGISAFLLIIASGALAKALGGIQNPRSYEDWVLFFSTLLGLIASGLQTNPMYLVYGLAIGYVGKAALSFSGGVNSEDILLFLTGALAGIGQALGIPILVNISLFTGALSKSIPSMSPPSSTPVVQAVVEAPKA